MRILQVSPYYSPRFGGSPQVVYQISRELSKRGHSITILAGDSEITKAPFPNENINTAILPSIISRWGFYFTPGMIRWCQKHINEFDIIHLHEVRTFQNIIVHWFARRHKIPYVLSAHGTLPVIVQRQFLKKLFDQLAGKSILKAARYLIAVSPFEAEQYRQAGIKEDRIEVVYNGLDLDEFNHLPARGIFRSRFPGLDGRTKIILFLGRLHLIKGINHLIEAFYRLQKDLLDTILVIAGPNDGELANLRTLANRLQLQEKVRFVGPLYGRDKLAAFVDADVLASASAYEIFGLVPFEAIMCGTPVIVSDDGGTGQLFAESKAGYLVHYGDVEQLSASLQYILTHGEEAHQKVISGQRYIQQRLNWKNIALDLEQLYQSAGSIPFEKRN